jgi:hypothetical protein
MTEETLTSDMDWSGLVNEYAKAVESLLRTRVGQLPGQAPARYSCRDVTISRQRTKTSPGQQVRTPLAVKLHERVQQGRTPGSGPDDHTTGTTTQRTLTVEVSGGSRGRNMEGFSRRGGEG